MSNKDMSQLEFFEIPSPCVRVCEANNKGFCKGCFRSREERQHWLEFSDEQKRQVIRLCQSRKARVLKAKQDALNNADAPEPNQDQDSLF